MFGRHALHNENHDVAAREVYGRAVCRPVDRCEAARQLFGREEFPVADAARTADGAQDAERIAQNQVGLAAVRSVERGVGEGDRPRHAGHAAAHAGDAESGCDGENRRAARIVAPAPAQETLFAYLAAVAPHEQGGQGRRRNDQIPVFGHEFADQLQRVAVVGEEDFIGGEPLLRVAEIDAVGHIDRYDQHGVYDGIVPEQQTAVPLAFARVQRQQREQYEHPVGVDDRRGVEFERTRQQLPQLSPAQRSQQLRVVEIENHAAEHQHRVKQCDAQQQQQGRGGVQQAFHVPGCFRARFVRGLFAGFERHVERLDLVCQRADRDEIDAALGVVAYRVERRLRRCPPANAPRIRSEYPCPWP